MNCYRILSYIFLLMLSHLSVAEASSSVQTGSDIAVHYNSWNWRVVDEQGTPLNEALVFEFTLWFGSNQHSSAIVSEVENRLKLPKSVEPLCLAVEDWITANPEPFEIPELENMYKRK